MTAALTWINAERKVEIDALKSEQAAVRHVIPLDRYTDETLRDHAGSTGKQIAEIIRSLAITYAECVRK